MMSMYEEDKCQETAERFEELKEKVMQFRKHIENTPEVTLLKEYDLVFGLTPATEPTTPTE